MVVDPYPSKKMMLREFVSWDDFPFPTVSEVMSFSHVPNHQPDILLFKLLTIIDHRLTIELTRKIP